MMIKGLQKIRRDKSYTENKDPNFPLMTDVNPEYASSIVIFNFYILRKHNSMYNKCKLNFIIQEKKFNSIKNDENIIFHLDHKIFDEIQNTLEYEVLTFEDRSNNGITEGNYIFKHSEYPIYFYISYECKENENSKFRLNINEAALYLYPNEFDGITNNKTIESVISIINCMTDNLIHEKVNEKISHINIITKSVDGFNLTEKEIEKDLVFEKLDLHYGKGFETKYNQLIKNINSNRKGIVLYHGLPGTGKTHCIKHLISKLENKIPIYVTSDMVDHFTDPEFIDFLLYEADILKRLDENLFFIIEDAEKLVMKRDNSPYVSTGISNLLNSTDGILNGMLNIQAILTFNTDIKNVDSAILRNERLLGEFEFGPIKNKRIDELAKYLKIKKIPDSFYKGNNVIADIYALKKERSIVKFKIEDETDNQKFIL